MLAAASHRLLADNRVLEEQIDSPFFSKGKFSNSGFSERLWKRSDALEPCMTRFVTLLGNASSQLR